MEASPVGVCCPRRPFGEVPLATIPAVWLLRPRWLARRTVRAESPSHYEGIRSLMLPARKSDFGVGGKTRARAAETPQEIQNYVRIPQRIGRSEPELPLSRRTLAATAKGVLERSGHACVAGAPRVGRASEIRLRGVTDPGLPAERPRPTRASTQSALPRKKKSQGL